MRLQESFSLAQLTRQTLADSATRHRALFKEPASAEAAPANSKANNNPIVAVFIKLPNDQKRDHTHISKQARAANYSTL
jgi:hypothetical protein